MSPASSTLVLPKPKPAYGAFSMTEKPYVQYYTFGSPQQPVTLESGKTLDEVTVAYETFGKPNADRSNVILICHALTGDSHVGRHSEADTSDEPPGWWEGMIGPGLALDTNEYWIICSNVLGGCQGTTGPSSLNSEGKPYGPEFPIITVNDMVMVQKALLHCLGVERLHAVVGGSIGGFQALAWATRYPELVERVVCLASASRLSAQGIAFNAVGRHAITSDPLWQEGHYSPEAPPVHGLATARQMAHITYLSEQILDAKFGRRLQSSERFSYDFSHEFAVESYLAYQGDKFVKRFDANTYLYLTKAMDYFDLAAEYGSLNAAMARTQSEFLLVSYTSDWLFPTSESQKLVRALRHNQKPVSFVELNSDKGHDAFLLELDDLTRVIRPFLTSGAPLRFTPSSSSCSTL